MSGDGGQFDCLPTPYYADDRTRIYHADAFELTAEVVPLVAAVVTDPPYGVGKDYGAGINDDELLVHKIATHLVPVMRRAPAVMITPGIRNMYSYPRPDHTMAWVHAPGGNGSSCSWGFNGWQPILCYGRDPFLARGLGRRPDLLVHNMAGFVHASLERIASGHPAPKPRSISEWLVRRATPDDDEWIVDPFMGSGSFVAAAKYTGRRAIGIELNERWCEVAATRLAQGVLDFDRMDVAHVE